MSGFTNRRLSPIVATDRSESEHHQQQEQINQTILKDLDGYAQNSTVTEHYQQQNQINQSFQQAMDGYAAVLDNPGDGYVAIFTIDDLGKTRILGDNDLFWDRVTNALLASKVEVGFPAPIASSYLNAHLIANDSISLRDPTDSTRGALVKAVTGDNMYHYFGAVDSETLGYIGNANGFDLQNHDIVSFGDITATNSSSTIDLQGGQLLNAVIPQLIIPDGYVVFGTGNSIAGDNDLYWDRVANKLKVNSQLLASDGNTAAPGLSFQSAPGSGLSVSPNNLILSVNGVTVISANSATQYQQFGGGSYYTLLGNQGSWNLYPAGGLAAYGNSVMMWIQQQQDSIKDVRLIGSANAAGEYSARIGTKYTAAAGGSSATLLQIGLDIDNLGGEVPVAEFYGSGKLSLFNSNKTITLRHTGKDGYLQTDFGDLILSPQSGRVTPGGADAYGLGASDNRWGDGYFIDLNTKGIVEGINNIVFADSPYLLRQNDYTILADASDGNIIVTLPAAGGNLGRVYNVKKIDVSGQTITITPSGTETIDGDTSLIIDGQWDSAELHSNGTSWFII